MDKMSKNDSNPNKEILAMSEPLLSDAQVSEPPEAEPAVPEKPMPGLHSSPQDGNTCSICQKKCTNKSNLKAHINAVHNKLKPASCTLCDKSFTHKGKLAKHVDSVHRKLKLFPCAQCQKLFTSRSSLKKHVDSVHRKLKPISCTLCDKSFFSRSYLTIHMNAVHYNLKPFSCTLCDKSFSQKGPLTTHIKFVHDKVKREKSFSCVECDKTFTAQGSLKQHVNAFHRKLKPFACTLCDQSFSKNSHLTYHINCVHHKMRPFSCTLCEKSYSLKKALVVHMRSHTKEQPFNCALCDMKFASKQYLKNHTDRVHRKLRPFSCSVCNKSFSGSSQLYTHIRYHKKDKPFSCTLCDTKCYTKVQLRKHVDAVHKKLRPYTCPTCKKSFSQKSYLNYHVKFLHNNPRMCYSCSVCKKRFLAKSALNQHMKFDHTEVVQNVTVKRCSLCPKQYLKQENLDKHVAADHAFVCTICKKSFASEGTLKAHRKYHNRCNVCRKLFNKKEYLLRHMMFAHKTSHPFMCVICYRAYRLKDEVEKHLEEMHHQSKEMLNQETSTPSGSKLKSVHSPRFKVEGKYQCSICKELFDKKGQLKKHQNICHKDEKVKCHLRNTGCSNQRSSQQRMKVHGTGPVASCPYCGWNYQGDGLSMQTVYMKHKMSCHGYMQKQNTSDMFCNICQVSFPSVEQFREHAASHFSNHPYICGSQQNDNSEIKVECPSLLDGEMKNEFPLTEIEKENLPFVPITKTIPSDSDTVKKAIVIRPIPTVNKATVNRPIPAGKKSIVIRPAQKEKTYVSSSTVLDTRRISLTKVTSSTSTDKSVPVYCRICQLLFPSVQTLREHLISSHNAALPDSNCTKDSKRVSCAPVQCGICRVVCPSMEKVKQHIISSHQTSIKAEEPYSDCATTPKQLRVKISKDNLASNPQLQRLLSINCGVCKLVCPSVEKMKEHMISSHLIMGETHRADPDDGTGLKRLQNDSADIIPDSPSHRNEGIDTNAELNVSQNNDIFLGTVHDTKNPTSMGAKNSTTVKTAKRYLHVSNTKDTITMRSLASNGESSSDIPVRCGRCKSLFSNVTLLQKHRDETGHYQQCYTGRAVESRYEKEFECFIKQACHVDGNYETKDLSSKTNVGIENKGNVDIDIAHDGNVSELTENNYEPCHDNDTEMKDIQMMMFESKHEVSLEKEENCVMAIAGERPDEPIETNMAEQGTERISCSVCAVQFDNMTDYTHHLNVHLNAQIAAFK